MTSLKLSDVSVSVSPGVAVSVSCGPRTPLPKWVTDLTPPNCAAECYDVNCDCPYEEEHKAYRQAIRTFYSSIKEPNDDK